MNFTLVSTVFNEAKRLDQTIHDLESQTLQPSEIIITDAGSTDGTFEMLNEWKKKSKIPITILQKYRCNVAEGRNMAIRAANYDLIASMDFGCRYHPDWLKTLMSPFQNSEIDVVGGVSSVIETEQITLASKVDYILAEGYDSTLYANSESFTPTSRSVAYRKEVFDKIGGYCEWLTLAADDTVFGKELRAKGYKIFLIDKPYVFWMRHAKAMGFIKEAFRYGLGDGEANINSRNFRLFTYQALSRIFFYITAIYVLISMLFLKGIPPLAFLLLLLFLPGFRPFASFAKAWLKFRSKKYNLLVLFYGFHLLPRIRMSYAKGYIKGYYFSRPEQKKEAELLQKRLLKA